jgi:hypothetical protein
MNKSNVTPFIGKVQKWAKRITSAYGDSVQAIIEVGRELQLAKKDCNHGEWGELTGQTTGKPLLPFSYQTAHRLKSIAKNTALSNIAHGRYLPASWRTLAILASLSPGEIEAAIADGTIHPDMQRKDAQRLVDAINGNTKTAADPFTLDRGAHQTHREKMIKFFALGSHEGCSPEIKEIHIAQQNKIIELATELDRLEAMPKPAKPRLPADLEKGMHVTWTLQVLVSGIRREKSGCHFTEKQRAEVREYLSVLHELVDQDEKKYSNYVDQRTSGEQNDSAGD